MEGFQVNQIEPSNDTMSFLNQKVRIIATGEFVTVIAINPSNNGKLTIEDSWGYQNWVNPSEVEMISKVLDNDQQID